MTHSEKEANENQMVPEGAIDGIYDIVEERLSTKDDLTAVLKF
jgi:hypothetical protein